MRPPKSTIQLAERLILSWSRRGNCIVVTPPLTEPLDLWPLLREPARTCANRNLPRLSVAYVDPSDFKDKVTFTKTILKEWNVRPTGDLREHNLKSVLTSATKKVFAVGSIPVLLIPRFHEAIGKLDENIGYILREIEHSLSLRTVVALPLAYDDFLDYQKKANSEYSPFLNSEFGQGHATEDLRGYARDEIDSLLEQEGLAPTLSECVYQLSGGLPGLVKFLLRDGTRMAESSLRQFAKAHASEQCSRFVKWLDKPNHNIYKRLITERFAGVRLRHTDVRVEDHCWSSILLGRDGELRSQMVGWACADAYWRTDSSGLRSALEHSLAESDAAKVCLLVDAAGTGELTPELEAARLVAEFAQDADPLGDKWDRADATLKRTLDRATQEPNPYLANMRDALAAWADVTGEMARLCRAKRKDSNLRPEEFFAGSAAGATSVKAYFQFLALRLRTASKYAPAQARQAIVALPENILQMYCFAKLNLRFWKVQEVEPALTALARQLPWSSNYDPPATGTKMGFEDLLLVGWAKMQSIPQEQRIVSSEAELGKLRELYRKSRGSGAHSTDVVSEEQWQLYRSACEELLQRASQALFGNSVALQAPNLLELLLAQLAPSGTASARRS